MSGKEPSQPPLAVGYPPLHRHAWYRRLHAWVLSRRFPGYDEAVRAHKERLFGTLEGDVLEIGPGSGRSLPFFRRGVRWVGIEPNVFAHPYLREAGARRGMRVEVRQGVAERLPAADASVDAVVASLVLCTVADVEAALREVKRVLKPGGRFVFIEHVAAPEGTWTRAAQRILRGPQRVIGDGCHLDRETGEWIRRAGFSSVEMEHVRMPVPLVGPHIVGTAIR